MKAQPVTVERFYTENTGPLGLKLIAGAGGLQRIIREPTVNRPGLALAGFTKYFARHRIQVIGAAEHTFLRSLTPSERDRRYDTLLSSKVPAIVYSRNFQPDRQLLRRAEQSRVAIFSCPLITMKFINMATIALENLFAPRGSEMGSMVDILGVGVIIKGESGIGKSECVLALIERGYSLVADDITRVALVDGKEVIGTCAELTRNHMEVRGIGIINVAAMFGVKSIRTDKRVDLVVSLRSWNEVPDVDRLGLEDEYVKILGVDIPHITIPVKPGRDIARLVEVAAFQNKLKASGYNPARELNDRLLAQMNQANRL
jgi:HPr kinase/phosphorylase